MIDTKALLALARAAHGVAPSEWTTIATMTGPSPGEMLVRTANGLNVANVAVERTMSGGGRAHLARYIAAASPDVTAALCDRIEALEAKLASVTAIDDIAVGALVAGSNAATARIDQDAARIEALEATVAKQALHITHLVMQIRGHDWHEEVMAARARIAALEAGLVEACGWLRGVEAEVLTFEQRVRLADIEAVVDGKPR